MYFTYHNNAYNEHCINAASDFTTVFLTLLQVTFYAMTVKCEISTLFYFKIKKFKKSKPFESHPGKGHPTPSLVYFIPSSATTLAALLS